jgi:hypothetical protein
VAKTALADLSPQSLTFAGPRHLSICPHSRCYSYLELQYLPPHCSRLPVCLGFKLLVLGQEYANSRTSGNHEPSLSVSSCSNTFCTIPEKWSSFLFSPSSFLFTPSLSVSFGLSVSSFLAERPVWHPIFYDGQKWKYLLSHRLWRPMKWFSFLLFFTVSVMGYNYVAQAGLKLRTHSVLQTRLEHAIFFFFFFGAPEGFELRTSTSSRQVNLQYTYLSFSRYALPLWIWFSFLIIMTLF